MKKLITKILSLSMAVLMVFSLGACVNNNNNAEEGLSNDPNTINVKIRKAGHGVTYIDALAEQFNKTFETQGYKVKVLAPREDLSSTNVYRDIYSGSGIDVYFTSDVEAELAVDGDFGQVFADITESVYKKPAINFDGNEADKTIEQSLDGFIYDEAFYNGKVYGLPYAMSVGGLAVNKKVLDNYDLELPRTTKEMFDAADKIMTKAKTEDVFPFTFALTGNNYVHCTFNAWMAQYGGVEEYNKIWSYDNADGTPLNNPAEVYKYDSMKYAMETVYHVYDYNMAAWGSATDDFSTVQGKIMKGDAVFYSVGDWMFNEEFDRYSNNRHDVIYINTPVISALGTKLFGAGTSYGFDAEKCDKVLSTIIKYVDQNKLADEIKSLVDAELGENISIEDITTVCERRGIARINLGAGLVISEKSTKKEIAETFLRFCASEDAGKIFAAHSKSQSPYSYKTPENSEYAWINSANRVLCNPYLTQIQSKATGTRKKISGVLFPEMGEYFTNTIYEEAITKYEFQTYVLIADDSVYTDAAVDRLKVEYDYVKEQFDSGKWKVNG